MKMEKMEKEKAMMKGGMQEEEDSDSDSDSGSESEGDD